MSIDRATRLWAGLAVVSGAALVVAVMEIPFLSGLGRFVLVFLVLLGVAAALTFLLRRFLWRVGRRLAVSYFLLGILPIPMVLVLVLVAAYLLSGFFMGHLYRQASVTLGEQLATAAETRLQAIRLQIPVTDAPMSDFAFAYYRDGQRVGGDARAPTEWPIWLEEKTLELHSSEADIGDESSRMPPLTSLDDATLTVAAAAARGDAGVVAFLNGDLEAHLRRRSDVWLEVYQDAEDQAGRGTSLNLFGQTFYLQPLDRGDGSDERWEYIAQNGVDGGPMIIGFELAGPVRSLHTGEIETINASATLTATPQVIYRNLFSQAAEVDTLAWLAFVIPAFLLFDIYALAAFMAILMIVSLSRAVNRLSTATAAVQAGDFAYRIPVKRKDQLGALQHNFNNMAVNLEHLVIQEARKEVLEKELDIAREVQKNLLPHDVEEHERYDFATHFEPSSGIAGDYFDIFPIVGTDGRTRLAVVIADVSGHGLSAGMRMAMLKAGLLTLVQEGKEPEHILASLDRLVRSTYDSRSFVTATLAILDPDTNELSITNAGHLPTYLIRGGEVQEISVTGTPLGTLGRDFGRKSLTLESGDTVVWLSDGFIEATDGDGNPFGFPATVEALGGEVDSASDVKQRLLRAIQEHTESRDPEDDRTLVVLRLRTPASHAPSASPDLVTAAGSDFESPG